MPELVVGLTSAILFAIFLKFMCRKCKRCGKDFGIHPVGDMGTEITTNGACGRFQRKDEAIHD